MKFNATKLKFMQIGYPNIQPYFSNAMLQRARIPKKI